MISAFSWQNSISQEFQKMIVKMIQNLENKMELQINSLETRIEKMQERFNKDLEASEVRGDSGEELPHTPTPEARGCSREELPKSKARGGGWEELSHVPTPEARGGGREDQPHVQGAMAVQAQEGLEELSHVEGQEGWW